MLCSVLSLLVLYLCFIIVFPYRHVLGKDTTKDFVYNANVVVSAVGASNVVPMPALENPPPVLRAVYVTGWSAGNKKYLEYVDSLFKTTQINAVVIDVKDSSGVISYTTDVPLPKQYKAYQERIPDINALIASLHSQGIYVIGRIAVFEDPELAKNRPDLAVYDTAKTTDPSKPVLWQDNNGLSWVDPASQQVWDYDVSIAKEAASHGFDEINFDYVRFPTDGERGTMGFPVWDQKTPKSDVIESFFKKLRNSLSDVKISSDIFGQTTTNTDDMGIGQIFENSLSYFDYISPMVYPSHYVDGFIGYNNPAEHPYEIIKYAIDGAVAREQVYANVVQTKSDPSIPLPKLAKIRPWIQDFNLGAEYNVDMVNQEIKAVSDATGKDFVGYLVWNPSNVYTLDTNAPK